MFCFKTASWRSGWSQTCNVADDLELLIFSLYLPSAGIAGGRHHTQPVMVGVGLEGAG